MFNPDLLASQPYGDGGIVLHSTPAAYRSYAIFCVGNDFVREAAFRAWAADIGLGFKSLCGSYDGVQERSFIVAEDDLEACRDWWQGEDSVLHLSPLYRNGTMYGARKAHLTFNDGRPARQLGLFISVPREYALRQPGWTLDPSTGEYYVAEGGTKDGDAFQIAAALGQIAKAARAATGHPAALRPGFYAGEQGERTLEQWQADAVAAYPPR